MNKQEIMDKMVAALMDQERDDVNEMVEKALEAVIPEVEDFPYAIRVVSEILSSNGLLGTSSSVYPQRIPMCSDFHSFSIREFFRILAIFKSSPIFKEPPT